MPYYRVEFEVSAVFSIDVEADSEQEARLVCRAAAKHEPLQVACNKSLGLALAVGESMREVISDINIGDANVDVTVLDEIKEEDMMGIPYDVRGLVALPNETHL